MKKHHIIYLVVGIIILILFAGGWYAYKYRECVKKVSYVPSGEHRKTGGYLFDKYQILDNGDYYIFDLREFKTSEDAMRACIWK
jgi:hypothetical protein